MRHRGWRGGLRLWAVLVLAGGMMWAADEPDLVDQAKFAMQEGQYLIARQHLKSYLGSSIGAKRTAAAKELLEESYSLQATQLLKAKQPVESAMTWIEAAEFYKDGEQAGRVRKSAQTCLEDAYKDAIKRKDTALIVDVAEAYAKLFPTLPALASPDQLNEFRADLLAAAVQKRFPPEAINEMLTRFLAKGMKPEAMKARKIQIAEIRRTYAQSLIDEGYLAKAIKLLEKAESEVPEADRTRLTDLLGRAMMLRLEAFASLGNLPMVEQAMKQIDSHPKVAATNKAKLQPIRAAVEKKKKAIPRAGPTVIKEDKPLLGNGSWVDEGTGYTIEGTVTLKGANITVEPGFVLEKGSIYTENGRLELLGTPQRPIIFRKVHISEDLGGSFKAEFAVFEDCTFSKAGWNYAHYSAKWQFSDCLFVRSTFSRLTEVDYGVKILGCAFLDCTMPLRHLCPNPPGDAAKKYRDDWNVVEACGFVKCKLPPSFVWMTRRCGFAQCTVEGWDNYRSTTDLEVLMAVPAGSMDFLAALEARTQHELPPAVHYINASPQQASRRRPMPAWRFVAAGE